MNRYQRINAIKVSLFNNKKLYISNLAIELNVSERTLRRDLTYLSEIGVAELFFGGAKLVELDKRSLFKNTGMKNIMSKTLNIHEQEYEQRKNLTNMDKLGVYVLGSFNIDIVSEQDFFPKVGETIRATSTNFYAGGKGSNQATAAAKVNKNVHLAVKIGIDEFGDKAKKHLNSTDINSFSILLDEEKPTGNAMIFVSKSSGDNMIAIDLGANENIQAEEISEQFSLIKDSKVFLTQLENNFDMTKLAIEFANRTPSLVILNPAPYNEKVKEIIHLVDIVTPNETEAESLSGVPILDIESAKNAAEKIHNMGVKIVIITRGAKGALLFDGQRHRIFPPYKAVVTDTSGAGDAFNGALAACIANDKSLEYAIKYATAFASLAVELNGASNMPEATLVESRLLISEG